MGRNQKSNIDQIRSAILAYADENGVHRSLVRTLRTEEDLGLVMRLAEDIARRREAADRLDVEFDSHAGLIGTRTVQRLTGLTTAALRRRIKAAGRVHVSGRRFANGYDPIDVEEWLRSDDAARWRASSARRALIAEQWNQLERARCDAARADREMLPRLGAAIKDAAFAAIDEPYMRYARLAVSRTKACDKHTTLFLSTGEVYEHHGRLPRCLAAIPIVAVVASS